MARLPALTERYRFLLVPLPVLGSDSEDAVARLGCLAASDAAAARDALLNDKADELPEPTPGCGQAPAQRALVTAQLLGIAGVPYLIAPDGRLWQGVPEDLEDWLEETRRIAIVLTDGVPNNRPETLRLLALCGEAGIETARVGIQTDIGRLFPVSLEVTDVADLRQALFGVAERLFIEAAFRVVNLPR